MLQCCGTCLSHCNIAWLFQPIGGNRPSCENNWHIITSWSRHGKYISEQSVFAHPAVNNSISTWSSSSAPPENICQAAFCSMTLQGGGSVSCRGNNMQPKSKTDPEWKIHYCGCLYRSLTPWFINMLFGFMERGGGTAHHRCPFAVVKEWGNEWASERTGARWRMKPGSHSHLQLLPTTSPHVSPLLLFPQLFSRFPALSMLISSLLSSFSSLSNPVL